MSDWICPVCAQDVPDGSDVCPRDGTHRSALERTYVGSADGVEGSPGGIPPSTQPGVDPATVARMLKHATFSTDQQPELQLTARSLPPVPTTGERLALSLSDLPPVGGGSAPRAPAQPPFEPTVIRRSGEVARPELLTPEGPVPAAIEPTVVRRTGEVFRPDVVTPDGPVPAAVEPTVVRRSGELPAVEPTVVRRSGELPRLDLGPPAPASAAPGPSRERTDPLLGTKVGDYEVKGVLGAGAMGVVFEGYQPVIGKRVAIKVLKKDFASNAEEAQRFLAEARAANAIGHRGIIDIFGFDTLPDGRPYFVMEYLQGRSLGDYLDEHAPLPVPNALQILDEILAALGAAHAAGVIHRDLKPNNIFLVSQPDGTMYVKLLDFGLAKRAPIARGETPQTRVSRIIGTPDFMAPEQARGEAVGPRTDLYSLGVVAFQMLTGGLPFEAATAWEVVTMHMSKPPPEPADRVSGLPPELNAVVLRLLSKAPPDRPETAEVVRQELKRIRRALRVEETRLFMLPPKPEEQPARAPAPPAPRTSPTPAPAASPRLPAVSGAGRLPDPSGRAKRLLEEPTRPVGRPLPPPVLPTRATDVAPRPLPASSATSELDLPPAGASDTQADLAALGRPSRRRLVIALVGVGVAALAVAGAVAAAGSGGEATPEEPLKLAPIPKLPEVDPTPPVDPVAGADAGQEDEEPDAGAAPRVAIAEGRDAGAVAVAKPRDAGATAPLAAEKRPGKELKPGKLSKEALDARYARAKARWEKVKPKRPPEEVRLFEPALVSIGAELKKANPNRVQVSASLDDFEREALGRGPR